MKTSKIIAIGSFLILAAINSINAQSTETRTLEPFSKINVKDNSKVYFTQGSNQQVKVETEDDINEVQTVVKSGTLNISGDKSILYITALSLEEVSVSGLGEVRSDSMIHTSSLTLAISGKGKIVMPVQAEEVNVNISGSGKMKLNGTAKVFKLNVSGNGIVDAADLIIDNADVRISGVGKATVDVREELNMEVSGVGSVYYKTEPKKINKKISGIGKFGMIKTEDSDTTTVHLGKKRIMIIGDGNSETGNKEHDIDIDKDVNPKPPAKSRSHWGGFDLGFNNFFTDQTSTSLPKGYDYLDLNSGKSVQVGLNLFKHDFNIYKRYIVFTTGIGLTLNNYRFNSNKSLRPDSIPLQADFDYNDKGEQISYKKNKLAVNYVTVPLLIQFNTNKHLKKSIHFAAGMLFSYKFNSHLKLVYDKNGDKQKTKRQDDFSIEPFRYDATVRIGFRNYTIFGSYAISELFKNKQGPTVHPFAVGLQLAGW